MPLPPSDKIRQEQVGALVEEPNEFCGQPCVPQMNNAWENLNKTWKERLEKLEEAMQSAVQYQDTLQVRGRAVCVGRVDLGNTTASPLPGAVLGFALMQSRKGLLGECLEPLSEPELDNQLQGKADI